MCGINTILETARKCLSNLKQFKNVNVVIGNESCDLDSAISSLVYSLLINKKKMKGSIVVPVLNIPRIQLPVKTELNYFLRKCNIDCDSLVCMDEIDLLHLHNEGVLQLTLVDHHVLEGDYKQLHDSVVRVIDHRPQDPAWVWSQVDFTLQRVGSCSTLVAEKLLSQAPDLVNPTVALLLLGVIVIDTNIFSASAGLATTKDIEIAAQLESRCDKPIDRVKLFNELQSAKRDISSLTSAQLLIKDLKVTAGIPIAGLPIKVQQFLERKDSIRALDDICLQFKSSACVIYGMEATVENVKRDLAVYSPSNSEIALKIVKALLESRDPNLELQPLSSSFGGISLFEQHNIKATRKQILPIVKNIGESFKQ